MFKTLLAVIFSAVLLSSCVTRLTDFTIISSKNVDLSRMASYERGKTRISGEDKMHIIIFIPTKLEVTVKQALDNTIQSVPGCVALVDGVINFKSFYFFYGEQAYIVEGTPLIDPKLVSTFDNTSNYLISYLDEKGNVSKIENITKEKFEELKNK
jgi:hypothetical protein